MTAVSIDDFSRRASQARIYVRSLIARGLAENDSVADAMRIAETRFGSDVRDVVHRSIISSGDGFGSREQAAWFGQVFERSVLGRIGARSVGFNVRIATAEGGATAHWVGENGVKPVSRTSIDGSTLRHRKIASLIVATAESLRDPTAEPTIARDLSNALVKLLDATFLDVGNAGNAETPASITNGATAIPSSGNPSEDVAAAIAAFDGDLSRAVFIANPRTAAAMAMARDANGAHAFPNISVRGDGDILGIPLLTSRGSPIDTSGAQIALVDGGSIALAADLERMSVSREATVEIAGGEPGEKVSLWQSNCVGFLSEIGANWEVQQPGAVVVITGIGYTSAP